MGLPRGREQRVHILERDAGSMCIALYAWQHGHGQHYTHTLPLSGLVYIHGFQTAYMWGFLPREESLLSGLMAIQPLLTYP